MYERVLIAGGAGFIGSRLAVHLKSVFAGTDVVVLDNLRRRGSEFNLPALARAGVRFLHGDVRSPEDLAAVPAPGLIIEASAEPSAQAGYGGSPEYLVHTNLNGCFHCLELARRCRADFLFLSTSRVYPVARLNALPWREDETRFTLLDNPGVNEDFPLDGARSLYGMTKLAAELMITEYADAYGLRCVINRCGLIAGPGQMGKTDQGVVALWAAAHYFGRPVQYIGFGGTGKQVRDILHIADLCDLVELQVRGIEPFTGRLFNVGGGAASNLSLLEMTALCEEVTGRRITIASCPGERPADVRIYLTDHRRLTEFCGWNPRRSARDVLTDIHQWIHDEETLLRPVLAAG